MSSFHSRLSRFVRVSAATLLLGLLVPDARCESEARYSVTFSGARRRVVHLEAVIPDPGRVLVMSRIGARQHEDRWAHWVEDLVAHDATGREVGLHYEGDARWKIKGKVPDELVLAWKVQLDHDLEPWPFGWDEATYVKDDCIYLATDALFITTPDIEAAVVSFDLPPRWIVSSSWLEVPGSPWSFQVDGYESLTRTCLLVGEHDEFRFEAEGTDWTVAVGEELVEEAALVSDALEAAVREAIFLFGEIPGERFLLVANRADYTGGSAHVGGMSMLFGERPTRDSILWSYVLVHELIHMWNGITIRRLDAAGEWFNEGVTDYLAVLVLARAGLATADDVLGRMAESYRMYLTEGGELSLAEAGRDKRRHSDLVYGGGFWMGFLLDVELRAATGGSRTIEDLMQRLYEGQRTYRVRDLQDLTNEIAGRPLTKFFTRYVLGDQMVPVKAYLARMGLEVKIVGKGRRRAMVFERRDDTTERQRGLMRAVFGVE